MKKRIILVLLGLLPILFGFFSNYALTLYEDSFSLAYYLTGLFLLILWGVLAYGFYSYDLELPLLPVLQNALPLLMLVLCLIQALSDCWWDGFFGILTQLYYLPVMVFGLLLSAWSGTSAMVYIMSFVLFLAASLIGCAAAKKKNKI